MVGGAQIVEILPHWLVNFIDSGFWGVDGFFVLSGFILTHNYKNLFVGSFSKETYFRFLGQRLARFYPVHLLVLMIYVFLLLAGVKFAQMDCVSPEPTPLDCKVTMMELTVHPELCAANQSVQANRCDRFSATGLVKQLTLVSSWKKDAELTWNFPAWSMSSEWFAYLLFPLVMIFVARLNSITSLIIFGIFSVGVMLFYLWVGGYAPRGLDPELGLYRISGHFLLGCILYKLSKYKKVMDLNWSMIGLVSTFLIVFFSRTLVSYFFPFLLGIIVVSSAQKGTVVAKFFSGRIAQWLGGISYSLYMTQVLIFDILGLIFTDDEPQKMTGLEAFGAFIFMCVVSLTSAYLVSVLVENPCRRYLKNFTMAKT